MLLLLLVVVVITQLACDYCIRCFEAFRFQHGSS
jgi:hypothetical protein